METGSNSEEFSVSEVSRLIKQTLEGRFGRIKVRGEINSLARPGSGHLYFSLVDPLDNTRIQAACWRGQASRLSMVPEDGQEVIVHGRITAYGARSQYQLIVENIELAGRGALLKMLEERRVKLAKEGLFDQERKKKLPFLPRRIGVITSEKGAVWQDILHRIEDRFPLPIVLCPVSVQGEQAAKHIVGAIRAMNTLSKASRPDVLIVARGGGSMEDLLPFHDEGIVRAVAQSTIPVVSAVGHETDTTLIDYAADLRAPTPTAAAEMVVPVRRELVRGIEGLALQLKKRVIDSAENRRLDLQKTAAMFERPERAIESPRQRLDYAALGLKSAIRQRLNHAARRLEGLRLRTPKEILLLQRKECDDLYGRLQRSLRQNLWRESERLGQFRNRLSAPDLRLAHQALQQQQQYLQNFAKTYLPDQYSLLRGLERVLNSTSLNRTLERGFALIRDDKDGLITTKEQASQQKVLHICFADGVLKTSPAKPPTEAR